MNPVLAHLAMNHVPIMGALFALGLLAFALAARRQETLRVGLFFLLLTAVAAWPVSLTGNRAQDAVEESRSVPEGVIHEHEEAAESAAWAAYAVGVLALVGLVAFRKRPMPGWFKGLSLLGAVAVSAFMLQAANQGGKIAHEELRDDAPPAADREPEPGEDGEAEQEEEDEPEGRSG